MSEQLIDTTPIYLTEDFLKFLRLLERNGGEYQKRLRPFALELGLTDNRFRKIKDTAKRLKLVSITPQGTMFGVGRLPDIYRLKVTAAEWISERDEYHADLLDKRRAKSLATRKKNIAAGKLQKSLDREKREREEAAKRRQQRVVRAYPRPGPAIPKVTTADVEREMANPDLDVDAWADFD